MVVTRKRIISVQSTRQNLFDPWPSSETVVIKGGSVLTKEMIEEAAIRAIEAGLRAEKSWDLYYKHLLRQYGLSKD